jgi:hypothetical protein
MMRWAERSADRNGPCLVVDAPHSWPFWAQLVTGLAISCVMVCSLGWAVGFGPQVKR